jgi:hypothetical protein
MEDKRTKKSVDVINNYLDKMTRMNLLDDFLFTLVHVMFRAKEIPNIPKELIEDKTDLFHYIAPIIAFLIIFWIKCLEKPKTLDELITRSGLKALMKVVKFKK